MPYMMRIDLHGLSADRACQKLEAILFRERGIRLEIVHGNGHGILKRAVREFVQNCVCVERIELGEEMNLPGGSGITVAYTYN